MSDGKQSEGGDVAGVEIQSGEGSSMLKTLLAEIEKLKNENKHTKQALAAVTVNQPVEASTSSKHAPSGSNATQAPTVENEASSSTQTAQVVYVSRERKIKKFSGGRATDEVQWRTLLTT